MGNSSLPDEADFLSAAAVAALDIAAAAAGRIKGDPILAGWAREVGELPSWRDDPHGWAMALHAVQAKYKLPSDSELASRTIEQTLFNRVRFSALDALSSRDPRARNLYLSMASIAAGALLSRALGPSAEAAIEAAVSAAHYATGSMGGKKSNRARNAIKRAASTHLSDSFSRVPFHEKGAAEGKVDLPTLAETLRLFPATSHLPQKTRKLWAKAWALEKLNCTSDREA